jgi:hypothetical protein
MLGLTLTLMDPFTAVFFGHEYGLQRLDPVVPRGLA